jgi:outer membrane protein assembly factor BamB
MTRLAAFFAFLFFVSSLAAADWPQWRGPKRDGVSDEKGLLTQWPEGGPKLAWKYTEAGLGFSSFAIREGKLYTLGTKGKDEIVLVLDASKGGPPLWTAKIGSIFTYGENVWGDGPRSTPTLDGNLLFALGGQGDLVCVDIAKNGAEIWRKNLISDFGGEMMTTWGYSESPLVDGDQLLVTPGGKKGLMVALNKKTGALLWQSAEVAHSAPYSSIMPADFNGVHQYIQMSFVAGAGGFVSGLDAKSGKLLWQEPIFKGDSYAICPTPIVHENTVYVTTGYSGGCHAFEILPGFKVKERYSLAIRNTTKNTHGGVVLVDGHIYGHSEVLRWICQNLKSGKITWKEREALDTKSGAITAADGMLYLFTEDGDVGLVKANPEKFELVSEFKLPQLSQYPQKLAKSRYSKAWSHPVVANGKLYLRDCEFMYCYDIK